MTDKAKLDYKELSMFLLRESVNVCDDFLEMLNENCACSPFYFSGPRSILEAHSKIGEYLKYANITYQIWIDESPKDGES